MTHPAWSSLTPAVRLVLVVWLVCVGSIAQTAAKSEDTGYVFVNQEHVPWPSPESILRDLRSTDEQVRLGALKLAGLGNEQAHEAVWSQSHGSPSKIIGQAVVTPARAELIYASLGKDADQQAIIAFEVPSLQSTFLAVAPQKGQQWERIAAISCWCKYDMNPDEDALAGFVSLHPAPEPAPATPPHYELVVRSSGGGTGIYTQNEAHFRVYRNDLRSVLSFVSGYRSNDPTGPDPSWVYLERRWFTLYGDAGGILVEAKGKFPARQTPEIQWTVRALQDTHLQQVSCRNYRWNAAEFRYEPQNGEVTACKAPTN